MAQEVRIEVVVDSERGRVATQKLTREMDKLPGAAKKMEQGMRGAGQATNNMAQQQAILNQKLMTVGQQMGVTFPTAVQKAITSVQGLGSAINTAFQVSVFTFFATQAFALLGRFHDWLVRVTEKLTGLTKELKEAVRAAGELNEELLKATTMGAAQARAIRLKKEIADLELALEGMRLQGSQLAIIGPILDWLQKKFTREGVTIAQVTEQLELKRKKLSEVQAQIILMSQATGEQAEALKELTEAQMQAVSMWDQLNEAMRQGRNANIAMEAATVELQIAQGDPRVHAEIMRQKEAERAGLEEILRVQKEAAKVAEQRLEQMAAGIEAFFDRVFFTAKSFSDVWKQLWMQLYRFFVAQVARMVAAWILGQRQMAAASGIAGFGGGGGILGGVLGGLFGLPGVGLGAGGTAPTASLAGRPWPGVTGISAGLGAVAGPTGTVPGVGGAGGMTATMLARGPLLAAGIAGLIGLPLLGRGITGGNIGLGALGGFLTGGAAGLAIASTGAFGWLGAMAGPIGAIAGLILGGIFAALRRGKLKRQAAEIANQGFAQMQEVLKAFEQFQMDYESAITQVTSIWEQMVTAWQGMGKVGRRSIAGQQVYFQQVLTRIDEIQRAREARAQILGALPIPEYQLGGMVRAIYGHTGRILAFLHAGEAVLNRRAVQAVGEQRIEELNRGQMRSSREPRVAMEVIWSGRMQDLYRENRVALVRFIRRERQDGVL